MFGTCVLIASFTNYSRLALEFSLQDGSLPKFSLDEAPITVLPTLAKTFRARLLTPGAVDDFRGVSPEVLILLLDVSNFASLLNNTNANNKIDGTDYQDCLCILTHRLLDYAPLAQQRPANSLDNMVHLTLVALMTTLVPEYTNNNRSRYHLLTSHLHCALNEYAATVESANCNRELLLWALYVGYISIFNNDNDSDWLIRLASAVNMHLDLRTWTDVRWMLCQYGWIYIYFDKSGVDLWNRVAVCP
jgi:hypothetical protein